jgi:excisionase family DNA binding protein
MYSWTTFSDWVAQMDDRNFSVTEAAQYLRVSRSFFYTLLTEGSIRAVKLGSRTIIPGCEIQRFMTDVVVRQKTRSDRSTQRSKR